MLRQRFSVPIGWAIVAILSVMGACTETLVNPVAVAVIEVTPSQANVAVGQTVQLAARLQDKDGHDLAGRELTWSSSSSGVASVDGQGLVRGEAPGQASIQASSGGITGLASVTVAALQAVRVDPASLSFTATPGGTNPAPQTVSVTAAGEVPVSGLNIAITYGAGEPGNWLNASVTSTTTPLTLTVSVSSTGLSAGTYHATVEIRPPDAASRTETVAVTLEVQAAPPAAPSDLRASAISSSRIDLGWQDNSTDEIEFRIERRVGTSGTWSALATVTANSATYSDTNVAPSTTYQYRVRACGAPGCSAYSNEATAATPAQSEAPAAPSGLVASAASTLQIDLHWQDNSSNETEFRVEQRLTSGTDWTQIGTVGANVTSYSAVGLSVATSYTFRVRACNTTGCSPYSAEATAVTFDLAPTPPSDLTATATSTTEIDLTWADNSSNETEFRVERRSGADWVPVVSTAANATSYQDTGLTPSVTYDYRVAACNTSGCSGYSNEATATTGTLPLIVLAPSAVGFADTEGGSNPAPQTVSVTNGGGGVLTGLMVGTPTYGAGQPTGWLAAVLDVDTAPATVTLSATTGVLAAGTYTATVEVTSAAASNSPQTIAVTFTVGNIPPHIVLSRTSVTFTATAGGNNPSNETVLISNAGAIPLTDLTTTSPVYPPPGNVKNWLDPAPSLSSSSAPSTLTLAANIVGINAGTYTASFDVESSVADNSPQTVTVTLVLNPPPTAPSGLTAGATAPGQITITWSDNSGNEDEFRIERSTNGGSTWSSLTSVAANTTSYHDTGLAASTTYSYRVRACRTGGCSTYSNTASAETAPAAPSGLAAVAVSPTQINLSWTDNASDEDGFEIEQSTNGGSTWLALSTVGANATSYNDTGLSASTVYSYRLRACRTGLCSDYSNTATATTASPPTAPSALGATAITSGQIDLSWTDNSGNEDQFRIERNVSGGAFSLLTTVAANISTYSDMGLSPSTSYGYRVQACRAGACSTFSNTASATTAPAAPSSLTATPASASQIDLAWTDNSSDEDEFRIERSPDGAIWSSLATVAGNVVSYHDTGLTSGSTYFYRVRACRSGLCSGYSNAASATTSAAPVAPGGLSATAVSESEIDLSWTDNSSDEDEFRIERSPDGTNWSSLTAVAANSVSYHDTGLTSGSTYYYRVRACKTGLCSGYSNTASATTAAPPTPPTALAATAISSSRIDLSWTDNSSDETGFEIERSTDGGSSWSSLTTVAADLTSYSDMGLTSSTAYTYRLRACRGSSCSAYTNTATATTAPATPSSFAAAAVSTSRIDLTWVDNSSDETGFEIQRSTDGGATWNPLVTAAADVQSYSDTGLTAGTTYTYQIRACRSTVCSDYAASASATTQTPPAAPSGLSATSVSEANEIDLSWTDNSTDEDEFRAERSDNGGANWTQIASLPANTESYNDTGLAASTPYVYRVTACRGGACSSYSNTATATTAPAAPSGLAATAVSSSEIDLSWTDNSSDETGFNIETSPDGSSWSALGSVGADVTSYQDTGLAASTEYFYRVQACRGGVCSAFSAAASATTQAAPPPTAPSGLAATAVSSSEIDLSWTDNSSDETGFNIETSPDGSSWNALGSVGANVTSYQDTGLAASTEYFYRVQACRGGVCSAFSAAASATTQAAPPLTAPSGPGTLTTLAQHTTLTRLSTAV